MTTTRTTFSLDEALAEEARALGVNVSAAARDGVVSAVRAAREQADRRAYAERPETPDAFWTDADVWGAE